MGMWFTCPLHVSMHHRRDPIQCSNAQETNERNGRKGTSISSYWLHWEAMPDQDLDSPLAKVVRSLPALILSRTSFCKACFIGENKSCFRPLVRNVCARGCGFAVLYCRTASQKTPSLLPGRVCGQLHTELRLLTDKLLPRCCCREEPAQNCDLSDNDCHVLCWHEKVWNSFITAARDYYFARTECLSCCTKHFSSPERGKSL